MRFKDFILEKAMNSATYADIAKRYGESAKVGFEFEMLVPEHSDSHYSGDPFVTTDTVVVDRLTTRKEIEQYFDVSSRDDRIIDNDFNEYVAKLRREYMADNFENFLDDDGENEAEAEEKAGAEFDRRDTTDFEDWVNAEYRDTEGFVDAYGLDPTYGYDINNSSRVYTEQPEVDSTGDHQQTSLNVASSFNKKFGVRPLYFSGNKSISKSANTWYLENDGSIEGEGFGVELVTPPLPLSKAIEHLRDVANWMQHNDYETNESTGLHINISIPDLMEKIDPLKLVLFMGERYVAGKFNRIANTYTAPHIESIMNRIATSGKLPGDEEEMIKSSWDILSTAKYHTVNLSKIKSGYLEFRVAGGKDYHSDSKIETIIETIMRFVAVVEIACDSTLERKEYLKKAAVVFGKAQDNITNKPADVRSTLPKEITRIANMFRNVDRNNRVWMDWKQYETAEDGSDNKRELLLDFMNATRFVMNKMKRTLEPKERVFLKMQAKKTGLNSDMIDSFFGDESENRADFKKIIGL
jgi:hypothetical protein